MHYLRVSAGEQKQPVWTWDGDIILPTFAPSIKVSCVDPDGELPTEICHYYLEKGRLRFLDDCTHALKGITMSLPPLPEMYRDNLLP